VPVGGHRHLDPLPQPVRNSALVDHPVVDLVFASVCEVTRKGGDYLRGWGGRPVASVPWVHALIVCEVCSNRNDEATPPEALRTYCPNARESL
jgi:hypothetical protein